MSSENNINNEASENKQDNHTQEADVRACGAECAENADRLLRVTADFQNYRTRMEKDRMQSIEYGQIAVLSKLLAIVDDVDRAIEQAKQNQDADTKWLEGFELISKSFYQMLTDHNVKPIDQMQTFDPELHEALTQVDSPDHESGAIIDIMQKGYMIGDRVLRPAKVTVAK